MKREGGLRGWVTNRQQIELKRNIEKQVRLHVNAQYKVDAQKKRLLVGQKARHEFDLYDPNKVIGGISTSPWQCSTGSNNSGGQDRVSAELLWLSVWEGNERRIMVLTNHEMATNLFDRWEGCKFVHPIEIIYYNSSQKSFEPIGKLK